MISQRTITLAVFLLITSATPAFARSTQTRDSLTPEEVELVREAQALDKRIDVFIKATDRRLMVLNGTTPNAKQLKKDAETWGDLPKGSRAELVGDIARILDEAITNIDDVSSRDEKNPLIPKALRRLAQAVNNIMTQLTPLRNEAKTEAEIASFEMLNEDARSILEAANKLPPEVDKKKKNDKAKI